MKTCLLIALLISTYSFSQEDGIKVQFEAINSSKNLSLEVMEILPFDRSLGEEPKIIDLEGYVEKLSDTSLIIHVPFGRHFAIRLTDETSKIQQIGDIHATGKGKESSHPSLIQLNFENGSKIMYIYYDDEYKEYVFNERDF